jgi:hypothetical protein
MNDRNWPSDRQGSRLAVLGLRPIDDAGAASTPAMALLYLTEIIELFE